MASCQETVDVMGVFEPLVNDGNVIRRYTRRYHNESGTNVENGRLVFEVPAQVDPVSFYDSSLAFKLQIVKKSDPTAALVQDVAELTALINQPGLSLVKHVDAYANGRKVASHQYHEYTAYLENKLNLGEEAKRSWLQAAGWHGDDAGKYDDITEAGNKAFGRRSAPYRAAKRVEMRGRPHTFPFQVAQLFPGEINWRFELELNDDAFMLLGAADADTRIKVTEPWLDVECVRLSPDVQTRFVQGFRGSGPAVYPHSQVALETYSIGTGATSQRIQHSLLKPQAPNTLLLMLVSEAAFMGERTLNPFSFKHHGLAEMQLKIDGNPVHYGSALKFDFSNGRYLDAYWGLCRVLSLVNRDEGMDISRTQYDNDQVIVGVDLTRLINPCDLDQSHDLNIELTFKAATTETLRLMCYATYAQQAEIGYSQDFDQGAQLLVKMAV